MDYKVKNEIDKWFEGEQSKLFDKHGVGFAFGKEQFEEYEAKQRALGYDGKFVSFMAGGLCRSTTFKDFTLEHDQLCEKRKEKYRSVFSMDDYIEYELSNHECYYTGNYWDEYMMLTVKDIFPEATREDFQRVYRATINDHE